MDALRENTYPRVRRLQLVRRALRPRGSTGRPAGNGAGDAPCVVLGHGWTGVREQRDRRLAAAVAQVPFVDGLAHLLRLG